MKVNFNVWVHYWVGLCVNSLEFFSPRLTHIRCECKLIVILPCLYLCYVGFLIEPTAYFLPGLCDMNTFHPGVFTIMTGTVFSSYLKHPTFNYLIILPNSRGMCS